MSVMLMIFGNWLPARIPESLMLTWAACAAVVAIIGLQNGWLSFGPLAIVILTGASIWGLPPGGWPLTWLVFAVGTLVFIERRGNRSRGGSASLAPGFPRALALAVTARPAPFGAAPPF